MYRKDENKNIKKCCKDQNTKKCCRDKNTKKCCKDEDSKKCCGDENKENIDGANSRFETELQPVKPLELVNFMGICEDGVKMPILYLCGDLQHVIFKNAQHLLGKYLTLVVPTHICDNKNKMYFSSLGCGCLEIQNLMGEILELVVTESEDCCAHYISIPVTEGSFNECDLVLQFTKFQLNLSEIIESDCDSSCECPLEWKWIASVVLENY